MDREKAVAEVQRCAAALTEAMNRAQECGERIEIHVVEAPREGSRPDRRQVVVHRETTESGRKPEDLNSANDY